MKKQVTKYIICQQKDAQSSSVWTTRQALPFSESAHCTRLVFAEGPRSK